MPASVASFEYPGAQSLPASARFPQTQSALARSPLYPAFLRPPPLASLERSVLRSRSAESTLPRHPSVRPCTQSPTPPEMLPPPLAQSPSLADEFREPREARRRISSGRSSIGISAQPAQDAGQTIRDGTAGLQICRRSSNLSAHSNRRKTLAQVSATYRIGQF